MTPKFFDRAYGTEGQEATNQLYIDWADSYDEEVGSYGYASPRRCAEALVQFLPKDAEILDFGCGTGLSGKALRSVGFTTIDGSEIVPEMLEKARAIGAYRALYEGDIEHPFDFDPGAYAAITAVGVISSGAGPASLLREGLLALKKDGLICFSYNDHALEDPPYPQAVEDVLADGLAEQLFCEYGDHLPTKNVGSNVYVLKRL
ncbi:MAG: methyltransferase domain-containing protein [Pseudomonadota bacterium]